MATAAPPFELEPKYDQYDFPLLPPNPASGHPGNLDEGQKAQVFQLRMLLEAEGCTKRLDTLTLVRTGERHSSWTVRRLGSKITDRILAAVPPRPEIRRHAGQEDVRSDSYLLRCGSNGV